MNLKYDWAHSKKIFKSPPKLKQLATVKTAVSLWYGALIDLTRITVTEREVQQRINKLELSEACKNYAQQIAKLIGEQLTEFNKLLELKNFLPEKLYFRQNQIFWHFMKNKLYWTSQGLIDKKSTAEAWADTIGLDVEARFQIAITFCLEDRINSLSVYLPTNYVETRREYLLVVAAMDGTSVARKHFGIAPSASDCIEYFQEDYSAHFTSAIRIKNDPASAYFWQCLTEQGKRKHFEVIKKDHVGEDYSFYSHYTLFMLTHCNIEKRIQLLKNTTCSFYLANELIRNQWLSISDAYIKIALETLTVSYVVELLSVAVQKLRSTFASTEKYAQICSLFLQFLCQKFSESIEAEYSDEKMMHAIYNLTENEEEDIRLVADFLQSVNKAWIKKQFSLPNNLLAYLITASSKCGVLDLVFNSALSNVDEREKFLSNRKIDKLLYDVISKLRSHQSADIDRISSLLFSISKAVAKFKKQFVKEHATDICLGLLSRGRWEPTNAFIHWSFPSKERKVKFFRNFFKSEDFLCFLIDLMENRSFDPLISLIKANSENGQLFSDNLILDVCLNILTDSHIWLFDENLDEIHSFFELMDRFLFAFFQDTVAANNFKKNLFTDKKRKLYISFPLKFLQREMYKFDCGEDEMIAFKFWNLVTSNFLDWICCSDENLKLELKEELNNSENLKKIKKQICD